MGAFKGEHDWSGNDGRNYTNVTPRHRCPVCQHGSWCSVKRDGSVALCRRVKGTRTKTDRAGEVFHVHPASGLAWTPPPAPPPQTHDRADAATRDAAYRAALAHLRLDEIDAAGLRARGLSDAAIRDGRYRTLPERGRAAVARAVIRMVGEDAAPGVPGIVWKENDGGRGWWSLSGWSGLLIPVRDAEGRIVALKVRRREVAERRYVYVTSSSAGGPSAENTIHVPSEALARREGGLLAITEGELKADVATHLCESWAVVSLPGVGSWRRGVEFARAWGARAVAVALDADWRSNPVVAAARRDLLNALRAAGWADAQVWDWDPKFKGIDDALLARRQGSEAA